MTAEEVITLIKNAFADTPNPSGRLSADTYDDEGTHDYFSGTTWDGHDVAMLRKHEAAMSFFTPEAFRYYLPCFMLAELTDPKTADILGEYVVSQFARSEGNWEDKRSKRVGQFTSGERRAIIAFLQYMTDTYQGFRQDDIAIAIERLS